MLNEIIAAPPLHAVSLFSNCGAGDFGYRRAGFRFDVMAELEPKRLEVCLLNHPDAVGVPGDVRTTWRQVVETYRERTNDAPLSLLAACPPCQGMSSARGLRGFHEDADAGSKDERNLLAVVIAKVANALNPQVIVVENVPEFLVKKVRHPDTLLPVTAANLLIERLEDRYNVYPILLDMSEFGVPQTRKRTFLTFVRRGTAMWTSLMDRNMAPFPAPWPNEPVTVTNALASFGLDALDAAGPNTAGTGMHSVPVWEEERYRMVAAIPPFSGASAWKNDTCLSCDRRETDPEIVVCSRCGSILPKPVVVEEDGGVRLIKGFHTSYKRMAADKPSAAILTASGHIGSHNTIHPYENRTLSVLECAYLQTLDADFEWGASLKKYGHSNVRAMIGEAVPPLFTRQHGGVLRDLLLGHEPEGVISVDDKRCKSARSKLGLLTVQNEAVQ